MKASFILTALFLAAGVAQASSINVTAPADGAQLTSPFSLSAATSACASENVSAMGYSIDYGDSTIVKSNSVNAMVLATEGEHTLHVKCWGPNGAIDHENIQITIVQGSGDPPPNVTKVSNVQSLDHWYWRHDPGTPGNATGISDIQSKPSLSGNARRYAMNFVKSGGEIYHISFGKDPAATHFIYDAQLWLDDPSDLANIEMDMNQVIANGETVIYGMQCDGYSGTWDVAMNLGTPQKPAVHWKHSNVACAKPSTWAAKTWHHVQLQYSRNAAGVVTYESVTVDGDQKNFVGMTGASAFHLGWAPTLLINFQLDGRGSSGTVTAYLDDVTISRW